MQTTMLLVIIAACTLGLGTGGQATSMCAVYQEKHIVKKDWHLVQFVMQKQ